MAISTAKDYSDLEERKKIMRKRKQSYNNVKEYWE